MTLIRVIDPRQCADVFPAKQSVGSLVVLEHVCILDTWNPDSGQVVTHDYGNWDYQSNHPAGRMCSGKLAHNAAGLWMIGARTLLGWMDFSLLPLTEVPLVPQDFAAPDDDNPYPEPGVDGGNP